jgi:hypothetical protein
MPASNGHSPRDQVPHTQAHLMKETNPMSEKLYFHKYNKITDKIRNNK